MTLSVDKDWINHANLIEKDVNVNVINETETEEIT